MAEDLLKLICGMCVHTKLRIVDARDQWVAQLEHYETLLLLKDFLVRT